MHDLSTETRLTRYTLRGALRAPLVAASMALTAVGAGVSAAGTIAGGNAAKQAGQAQQQGLDFKAASDQIAAGESRAAGERSAQDTNRKTGLLESTLQARGGGTGFSGTSGSMVSTAGDIAGRGAYEGLMGLYRGENNARGLQDDATGATMAGDAALAEGKAKQKASYLSAAGTIIGSAGSMFKTYSPASGANLGAPGGGYYGAGGQLQPGPGYYPKPG
jgi:hypothetical protein